MNELVNEAPAIGHNSELLETAAIEGYAEEVREWDEKSQVGHKWILVANHATGQFPFSGFVRGDDGKISVVERKKDGITSTVASDSVDSTLEIYAAKIYPEWESDSNQARQYKKVIKAAQCATSMQMMFERVKDFRETKLIEHQQEVKAAVMNMWEGTKKPSAQDIIKKQKEIGAKYSVPDAGKWHEAMLSRVWENRREAVSNDCIPIGKMDELCAQYYAEQNAKPIDETTFKDRLDKMFDGMAAVFLAGEHRSGMDERHAKSLRNHLRQATMQWFEAHTDAIVPNIAAIPTVEDTNIATGTEAQED
jgi:hypothetical protein